MSAYWDNDIVRIALPTPYTNQHEFHEDRARYCKAVVEGLKKQRQAIDDQLVVWQRFLDEAEGRVCLTCYGSKKIRVMIDVDESRSQECPTCDGTGLPKHEASS